MILRCHPLHTCINLIVFLDVLFLVSTYFTDDLAIVCNTGMLIFDIIGYIYQYHKLLRQVSPQEWIFKELQDIGNMEFRFAEEQPQDDYAAELAGYILFVLFTSCICI